VQNTKLTGLHPFTDEVDVKFDVLRALVMDRILGHVDGRHIVAERHSSLQDGEVELAEKSQMHSAAAFATARYSASALDLETVG
jgi:hypothetical protein